MVIGSIGSWLFCVMINLFFLKGSNWLFQDWVFFGNIRILVLLGNWVMLFLIFLSVLLFWDWLMNRLWEVFRVSLNNGILCSFFLII